MKTKNYHDMIALYEETMKNLDRLTVMFQEALKGAAMLDDKLQAERLRRICEDARREMRLKYFDAEDANKHRINFLQKDENK